MSPFEEKQNHEGFGKADNILLGRTEDVTLARPMPMLGIQFFILLLFENVIVQMINSTS